MKDATHLILDIKECEEFKKLFSKKIIKNCLLELVKISKMKAITKPLVFYYNHKEKQESGVTGFIIISDSHISIHTYPYKKSLYLDLFSCKSFDSDKIYSFIKNEFKPSKTNKKLIKR
ncbi:MAG: S-adenosylmethionine decarboxylase [Candidatus Woesearchaeota archaeon]